MARNSFATYKFSTNSTKMFVSCNPSIYASFPAWSYLRISIDGTLSYELFTDISTKEIDLGTGTKIVEITESGTSKPSSTIIGTFILSIRLDSGSSYTIIDTDTPANKKLFLGDSITNGSNATYLQNGYAMRFRDAGESVSVLGWGYGSITNYAGSEALRTATVANINTLMDGTVSNELIILLGTNDYAVDETAVATFQTYYADLLVAINAARSDIVIKCVSPTVRTSEGENGNGDTLDDFRNAVSAACSGKDYCTYVEGKTLITTDDLDDGVHPTNDGHTALYDALKVLV